MNLLIVGSGKGSWQMRGLQLGAALGARVTSTPVAADWQWADVAVLIKRAGRAYAAAAHAAGVPIVWDALDFWTQPAQNSLTETQAKQLLGAWIAEIRPALTIGATQAMADACGGVYLPHHSWAGLTPAEARETVSVVAYEGNPIYPGAWGAHLQRACAKRGWTFAVNPPDIRDVDLFVSVRDGVWDGYPCRQWKSGVKVGNAIAAGRPVIGQASAAMTELRAPSSVIERPADIDAALDAWTPYTARAAAVDVCRTLAPALTLSAIAETYRHLVSTVEARCAA